MGTTLERRVAELEARAQRLTRLLEQVTGMLEHLTGAVDPEYAERKAADRAWAAFIDTHDLQVWRSVNGDVFLFTDDRFWRYEERLLDGLRRALRASPTGATARDILVATWGPEGETADSQDAAAVGSRLYALSRRGSVVRITGKPCRWTIGAGRSSDGPRGHDD